MRFLQDHDFSAARWSVSLLGLLTLPLLAGCGGGGGGSNGNSGSGTTTTGTSSGTSSGTNTGTQPTLTATATTATGLTASLTESSSTVAVGGSLVYTLTLTNNTSAAVPIQEASAPPTAPDAALVIKGPTGTPTFEPLPGGPPIDNDTLGPGQSLTATETASGFATAGVYMATATFSDNPSAIVTVGPLAVTAQ